MKPIALFYHCLVKMGDPPRILPNALKIIAEQWELVRTTGLLDAAIEFHVGVNGGVESHELARLLLPPQASIGMNGLDARNENMTILAMEKWLETHPDWYVLYFHSKGATHDKPEAFRDNWRACMMRNLVTNWKQCVSDMDAGFEAVGCHWMSGDKTPPGQSIFAGNFWWAQSSFLRTLPSIMLRDRIKLSGLKSVESRYESEVWIGNGPRLPRVKDYHNAWVDQCVAD